MMIEQWIAFGAIAVFTLIFFKVRLNRVNFIEEKVKYCSLLEKEVETCLVNIFSNYPQSQMAQLPIDNGLIYKLRNGLSWQYIEVSNASFSPVRCDSVIFTDKKYPKFCWMKSTYLRALFKSNEKISKEVETFLNKFELGVETGHWGAILIRERKAILSSEIDEIIKEFESIDWEFIRKIGN
ncbi:hypothetical protein D0C16_12960 [Cellvibrio sp. KY-GH-1]|uniref:hypothetical protein n=1 Tax=Cellvibrio sp. KY-GH-1 TaxID=2303332 RepID=UPI001245EEA2|nr:hypothetical protein [Cellvibrio sp. KY-GH-1]QEY16800.1 hypothetical protein D0C16_12960 [Cellvibrio sp. KY-GH-1]